MDVFIAEIGKGSRPLSFSFSKRWLKIGDILLRDVIPNMVVTLPGKSLCTTHPWCFVMPGDIGGKKYFYFGSFVKGINPSEEKPVFALYTRVSYKWLCANLQSEFHVAFWLSRMLIGIQRQDGVVSDKVALKDWIKSLQRSCSPFWEALVINEQHKFRNRSVLLLSELSPSEEKIHSDNGTEIMPWKGWPGCIQMDRNVWLWRQTRYGKIIDSQRISR
ncbi:hypothetical protein EH228_02105 [Erwinia endophytica]|uniref:hypothetical protein n=1 Tax=Erwinia endophytica TaxID=1563158 RepID=UPI001265F492|nr:hypothetical protein [Erwinia endophytica]KAB8313477.1 hypothetical protein EH228_02105 [Erwinia endophytica]